MTHPGLQLRTAFLEPLGVSPSDLAKGLGVDRSTVSRLLSGKQPITPVMAAKLGAFFRVPARWWLMMQAEHDAAEVAGLPELVAGVTPLPWDPDVLLTPTGVLRLDAVPSPKASGTRTARTIVYDNGSVGLVGDEP